jgi:hypothetical protein
MVMAVNSLPIPETKCGRSDNSQGVWCRESGRFPRPGKDLASKANLGNGSLAGLEKQDWPLINVGKHG